MVDKVQALPDIVSRPESARSHRSQASALSGRAMPKIDIDPELEQQLRECFKVFDASGDGDIDMQEFQQIYITVTGIDLTMDEVQELIASVDDNNDGSIQLPEFLKLMSDCLKEREQEEEMVELFKAFGATDINDVITVGDLDKALQQGGESLNDKDLNLIFEELAGATKRQFQQPEKRYQRATGLSFPDFLLMMMPK